jgi:hypothetical protein
MGAQYDIPAIDVCGDIGIAELLKMLTKSCHRHGILAANINTTQKNKVGFHTPII